ncbi:hypothetical protein EDD53_0765 [Pacificibacter maritimus]|uniref:Uncharacterized protein n=1 Tax=Pacificibacter maritimus TaxID=762213 RepID=A0A3N4VCR9_9RHOB|nr:hypothetical protein [Pacificibacter maritimus]RPE71640.1 hypothetical protein EDD53_0765 [Pacificibacter maritimus]
MNIDRLLNMVIRQVMRRVLNKGIGAGINAVTKGRGAQNNSQAEDGFSAEDQNNAPHSGQNSQAAKQAAKRARKAARLGRMR